jgi:hydrogenase-4 component B
VLHATGTREIDQLGGLASKMPRTAFAFLFGAIAICGLPPLNGFVSELFVYLGLARTFSSARLWVLGAFGAPALALIGALAVACFVKAHGAVFLGQARSPRTERAHDPGAAMLGPIAVLGLACALIGLLPVAVAPALESAISTWAPDVDGIVAPIEALAPLHLVSVTGLSLLLLAAACAAWLAKATGDAQPARGPTWDCGYASPSPRMQYTASSFAQTLVGLFSWALRPEIHAGSARGLFPPAATFHSHVPDTVLDRAIVPLSRKGAHALRWFRWVQHGNVHLYLVYILATVLVLALVSR